MKSEKRDVTALLLRRDSALSFNSTPFKWTWIVKPWVTKEAK